MALPSIPVRFRTKEAASCCLAEVAQEKAPLQPISQQMDLIMQRMNLFSFLAPAMLNFIPFTRPVCLKAELNTGAC